MDGSIGIDIGNSCSSGSGSGGGGGGGLGDDGQVIVLADIDIDKYKSLRAPSTAFKREQLGCSEFNVDAILSTSSGAGYIQVEPRKSCLWIFTFLHRLEFVSPKSTSTSTPDLRQDDVSISPPRLYSGLAIRIYNVLPVYLFGNQLIGFAVTKRTVASVISDTTRSVNTTAKDVTNICSSPQSRHALVFNAWKVVVMAKELARLKDVSQMPLRAIITSLENTKTDGGERLVDVFRITSVNANNDGNIINSSGNNNIDMNSDGITYDSDSQDVSYNDHVASSAVRNYILSFELNKIRGCHDGDWISKTLPRVLMPTYFKHFLNSFNLPELVYSANQYKCVLYNLGEIQKCIVLGGSLVNIQLLRSGIMLCQIADIDKSIKFFIFGGESEILVKFKQLKSVLGPIPVIINAACIYHEYIKKGDNSNDNKFYFFTHIDNVELFDSTRSSKSSSSNSTSTTSSSISRSNNSSNNTETSAISCLREALTSDSSGMWTIADNSHPSIAGSNSSRTTSSNSNKISRTLGVRDLLQEQFSNADLQEGGSSSINSHSKMIVISKLVARVEQKRIVTSSSVTAAAALQAQKSDTINARGDWRCPKAGCSNSLENDRSWNFSSRTHCNACKTPKPIIAVNMAKTMSSSGALPQKRPQQSDSHTTSLGGSGGYLSASSSHQPSYNICVTLMDLNFNDTITLFIPGSYYSLAMECLLIGSSVSIANCELHAPNKHEKMPILKFPQQLDSDDGPFGFAIRILGFQNFLEPVKSVKMLQFNSMSQLFPSNSTPRSHIASLINDRINNRVLWKLVVKLTSVKYISASANCSFCHELKANSKGGRGGGLWSHSDPKEASTKSLFSSMMEIYSSHRCSRCSKYLDSIVWEMMCNVDDSSGAALMQFEGPAAVGLMHELFDLRSELFQQFFVATDEILKQKLPPFKVKFDAFEVTHGGTGSGGSLDESSSNMATDEGKFVDYAEYEKPPVNPSGDQPSLSGKLYLKALLDGINTTNYYEVDAIIDENKSKLSKNLRSKAIRVQERMSEQQAHFINYKSATTLTSSPLLIRCHRLISRVMGKCLLDNCKDLLKILDSDSY